MNNSPFKWTTSWSGIVLGDDGLLLPNKWTMTFNYNAISERMEHRDIAMQRLHFMFNEKLNTATWMNFENSWTEVFYKKLNTFIITLPSEPWDSMIGAAALCKAASITKDVFEFHSCTITSDMGYNVTNVIDIDEALSAAEYVDDHYFLTDGPWFVREDCGFTDILCLDEEDETVTLVKDSMPWDKHQLAWDQYDDGEYGSTTVVGKDERWIPMVIKGGRNKDNDDT